MNNFDIPLTIAANVGLIIFLELVWLVATFWAAWNCLTTLKGINRLTWLVAILAMPIVGLICYLMHGADEGKRRFKTIDEL